METYTAAKLLEAQTILETNLPTYKNEVGATDDEVQANSRDRANMAQAIANSDLLDEDKRTATGIKNAVYDGDPGEPIAVYPPTAVQPLPHPDQMCGAESRYRELKRRYKAAKGYTAEIGMALGFETETQSISPGSVIPTVEAFAAQTGYHAAIVIGNRHDSTMWKCLGRRMNAETWKELTSGTGKSGNVEIEPTEAGKPERMELKIQLYKNNEPYGQPSQPVYVTFNP